MMAKSPKIVKYLRISDEDIDLDGTNKHESNSIRNQRNLLNDFISKVPEFEGYEVIEELDDGQTGTNFSRSGAQRIIKMAERGDIYCIIVKDSNDMLGSYFYPPYGSWEFPLW